MRWSTLNENLKKKKTNLPLSPDLNSAIETSTVTICTRRIHRNGCHHRTTTWKIRLHFTLTQRTSHFEFSHRQSAFVHALPTSGCVCARCVLVSPIVTLLSITPCTLVCSASGTFSLCMLTILSLALCVGVAPVYDSVQCIFGTENFALC